jgi:hypothetical protein
LFLYLAHHSLKLSFIKFILLNLCSLNEKISFLSLTKSNKYGITLFLMAFLTTSSFDFGPIKSLIYQYPSNLSPEVWIEINFSFTFLLNSFQKIFGFFGHKSKSINFNVHLRLNVASIVLSDLSSPFIVAQI